MKRRDLFCWCVYGVLGLLILLTLGSSTVHAVEVRGVTSDTITVGLILDQTGPAANVTIPMTQAIRTYFKHINEQGGVNGRKIKFLVEDDRFVIPMALAAFKKLIFKDQSFMILGGSGAGIFRILASHVKKQKVPYFPMSFSRFAVDPFKKYVFIIADTYENQMNVLIDYIMKDFNLKDPRIAFILPDNEAGKDDLKSARNRLESYKLKAVTTEILNHGSLDASSQVMNIRRAKANCIVFCGTIPNPTAVLLRGVKKYGLKTPVFSNWGSCAEDVITMAGKASRRWYAVHPMASWYDEGPGVAMLRGITLKNHPGTEKPYRSKQYTFAWVMALVSSEGLKRAGRDLDAKTYIRTLEAMKGFETGGLTGPISYSPTSHKGGSFWRIYKADPDTGKFTHATGWRKALE